MESLNFVELIENNPITTLSKDYNVKLLSKIKENFTAFEQHLFLSSFYCYLKYHPVNDFVIDLDDVWKWIGYATKAKAKILLEKHFVTDKDYKLLIDPSGKQSIHVKGGHNIQKYLLNIKTFKLFCIKAGTKKADEIHEYFIKLEQIIQDTVQEETNELKIQLQQKDKLLEQSQNNAYLLREKTLLQQFPNNTQCIYYGIIDNFGINGEKLVKFGNSNFLNDRVEKHKKTYTNFYLINAFKVHNKIQIENAIKNDPILSIKRRNLIIDNINHNELLAIDELSFQDLDKIIKDIIFRIEYSVENYNKLFKEYENLKFKNKQLLEQITALKSDNKLNNTTHSFDTQFNLLKEQNILLLGENETLKLENVKLIKKAKLIHSDDIITDTNYYSTVKSLKKYDKNNTEYKQCFGTREEVWIGIAYKTTGGLIKNDLMINKVGKIVSKKKYVTEKQHNRLEEVNKQKQRVIDNTNTNLIS
jgi:hypothetical protein